MRENLVAVLSVTSSSAKILIQQLTLDDVFSPFYSYVIQYKEHGMNFSDAVTIPHNRDIASLQTTLQGLDPGTEYVVRVLPVRINFVNNMSESGWPSHGASFATGEYMHIII